MRFLAFRPNSRLRKRCGALQGGRAAKGRWQRAGRFLSEDWGWDSQLALPPGLAMVPVQAAETIDWKSKNECAPRQR